MTNIAYNVFFFVILNIVGQSDSLVELHQVTDNDILQTELLIRSTINDLFQSIKLKGIRKNPRLNQYGLIHNYFVSLTLKDYNNLEEIARLTRVDKKAIDSTSINFIDIINEILNEDRYDIEPKSNISSYAFNDEIVNFIDDYSNNIVYIKSTYGGNSPRVDIKREILNILENDERYLNATALRQQKHHLESDDVRLLDDNEFWVPDLRRIYEGKRTKIKNFPFMASVEVFNRFQCAGSIIKDDLVITAASCLQLAWNNRFYRENPAFLSVRIGSDYYEFGGESILVIEVYFYPSYNPKTLKNNVAIMRLLRKIKFRRKKKRVRKIVFDTSDLPLSMYTQGVTVVGWGAKTKSNIIHSPYENKLSCARLDVYQLEDCQDIYSKKYVTNKNFCAGFVSKGSGACNKDVGGPGIVSGVLKGIVSFGSPVCGTPDAPTVFTKVGYYADWIEEIMDQESKIPVLKKYTTTRIPIHTIYPKTEAIEETETTDSINDKTPYVDPLTVPYPSTYNSWSSVHHVFDNYLKTSFNSKEVDDLSNGKYGKSEKQNAGLWQTMAHQKQYQSLGITPVDKGSDELPQIPVFVSPTYVADETFKTVDQIMQANDIQIFKADETLKSSQESLKTQDDLDSGTSKEVIAKKDIQNGLNMLIKNVDLKQEIAEVTNNKSRALENNGHLDKTILTLLQIVDEEKGKKVEQLSKYNQVTTGGVRDENSELELDSEMENELTDNNINDNSLDENGMKIYSQQELQTYEKSQEEEKLPKVK